MVGRRESLTAMGSRPPILGRATPWEGMAAAVIARDGLARNRDHFSRQNSIGCA